jgi:hypothetical protein
MISVVASIQSRFRPIQVSISLNRTLTLLLVVLIGGCGDTSDSGVPAELKVASVPGVYAGVFPCDGCPGIAATLWLRSDGRFFFRQSYPADDAHEATAVYSLGRWGSVVDEPAIELSGAGPRRIFMRLDPDTLVMRTDSELEHRLTRDPAETEFSDTIRMVGMMRLQGAGATFTECWTDFMAPVNKGGDFARFRHQYRSAVQPGKAAYVELEGRFSWSVDGALQSLIIERFITIKSNGSCPELPGIVSG